MSATTSKIEEVASKQADHHIKTEAHMNSMAHLPTQISTLMQSKQKWRMWTDRFGVYVIVIFTIVTIVGTLIHLGVLKMNWFGH